MLLHSGLGNAENWGFQIAALAGAGYRAIAIDTRGHGRSTRAGAPFTYERFAADVVAVLDALALERAAFVGWSDGAITALILAMTASPRVTGVFAFGGSISPAGVHPRIVPTPVLGRMLERHARDYARLSPTPADFDAFAVAVTLMMKTEPRRYGTPELGAIRAPVAIVQAEHDEFIRDDHAAYLAASIPGATLVPLPDTGHFAPLQRPATFNAAMLEFLAGLPR